MNNFVDIAGGYGRLAKEYLNRAKNPVLFDYSQTELDQAKKNPTLFGDGTSKGLLPNPSLNHYSVGNCAEADAINKALNAGASLANLQLMTIHTTKKGFGKLKCACENCTVAFKGNVVGNHSGWKW